MHIVKGLEYIIFIVIALLFLLYFKFINKIFEMYIIHHNDGSKSP